MVPCESQNKKGRASRPPHIFRTQGIPGVRSALTSPVFDIFIDDVHDSATDIETDDNTHTPDQAISRTAFLRTPCLTTIFKTGSATAPPAQTAGWCLLKLAQCLRAAELFFAEFPARHEVALSRSSCTFFGGRRCCQFASGVACFLNSRLSVPAAFEPVAQQRVAVVASAPRPTATTAAAPITARFLFSLTQSVHVSKRP